MIRPFYIDVRLLRLALRCLLLVLALVPLAVWGQPVSNQVLRLDGDGDYAHLPADLFNDFTEATIEAWIKWGDYGYFTQPFALGRAEAFQSMGLNHAGRLSVLQFFIYDRDHKLYLVRAPSDLPVGQWSHLAAVSGRGGMQLYLNGALVVANSYTGSFAAIGESPDNYLGRSHWGVNPEFLGALDEVRVWSVARSGEQIRTSMHRRLAGNEPGLAALWNFDACGSGQAPDLSVHARHARLMGDAHCAEEGLPTQVRAPARLTGQVKNEQGTPVSSVEVRLARNGQWIARATTDASGRYQFTIFDPGPHDLAVHLDARGAQRFDVRLTPGQERAVDLHLQEAVSIAGAVRGLDGAPLGSVVVQALAVGADSAQVAQTVLSDERGQYRFVHLRPGAYRVRCHLPDRFVYYGGGSGLAVEVRANAESPAQTVNFFLAPFKKGVWKTYDTFDGLAANHITDIHQTADGLLWLTSAGTGVWSFDGEVFSQLTAAEGLVHDNVNALCETENGLLYFATEGGISRYDGKTFTNFTSAEGLIHDQVKALYEGQDGALWAATLGGIARLEGDVFTDLPDLAHLRIHNQDLLQMRDGTWYFATTGEGLWRYDGQRLQNFNFRQGLPNFVVEALYEERDGRLWLSHQTGISRFDGETFDNCRWATPSITRGCWILRRTKTECSTSPRSGPACCALTGSTWSTSPPPTGWGRTPSARYTVTARERCGLAARGDD